jgi:hypothetical protein
MGCGEGLLRVTHKRPRPHQLDARIVYELVIIQPDFIKLPGLQLDRCVAVGLLVDAVKVNQPFSIQVQLERVHADGSELICAAGWWRKIAGPAHAEIVVIHAGARRAVPPVEVDLLVDACERGFGSRGIWPTCFPELGYVSSRGGCCFPSKLLALKYSPRRPGCRSGPFVVASAVAGITSKLGMFAATSLPRAYGTRMPGTLRRIPWSGVTGSVGTPL